MYNLVLTLHSLTRWGVVIFGLVAIIRALMGWLGTRPWGSTDDRLGLLFTSFLDLQVLLGILLYIVSPITSGALKDFGAAMGNSSIRYFAVEHWLLMIVAVIIAHIGRSRSKKATGDKAKFKQAAIFYIVAFVIILLAIPWPFMSAGQGRGWL